jgi:S-adenosylmethionine:tRNA ribosyltransferase-isomerase
MDVRAFDFDLPPELIAQAPANERTAARLLQLSRATGSFIHTTISELPGLLRSGDLLVVNNTRVFPARLLGHRVPSGGAVECLLVSRLVSDTCLTGVRDVSETCQSGVRPVSDTGLTPDLWEALMHPGQKLKPGARVVFEGSHQLHAEVVERRFHGRRVIRLWTEDATSVDQAIDAIGHVPLPPYIKRDDQPVDRDAYQTVFARDRGSIAAPTAGLHFTTPLLNAVAARGVQFAEITLHVGYGTFQPVRVERVEDHRLEPERYDINSAAASAINGAAADGRRVIAVGTTTTRTIEAVAHANGGHLVAGQGSTDLFIYPGFQFRMVSGLLTNFHLPQSSLLMLVAAFAGRERVLAAYHAAIAERYRFYSYGDAMLIV